MILTGVFSGKNVSAETVPNGCNAGDIITVTHGRSGGTVAGTFQVKVGMEAVEGANFLITIDCDEEGRYVWRTTRAWREGEDKSKSDSGVSGVPFGDAFVTFENVGKTDNDGAMYGAIQFEIGDGTGDSYIMWMSGVKDGEDTANPETGKADNVFDPSISFDENREQSNAEKNDTEIDLSSDDDKCYANSGKLGWILCPIIEGVSNLGNWLWGEVETNFMQIRVGDFFQGDGGAGVQQAWSTFRDIANVIFIILFMFVIFSQLTGIGIDNYGIKKIMPKLIVVAILINLSYVICLLAVDLSNILGTGLNALFTSIADGIPVHVEEVSAGQSLVSYGLGGSAVAGGVLFSLLTNPLAGFAIGAALGLTVLGVVIAIVVSVAFLYIILVIRYAGVIILIAIAPLAIVCYMLPNTEKISKRWLDLLKALLLVYPICGALVGAGKLVGNILASTQNETMVVAGMIVGVLPFFLIPMLLKQSLALMGNIGARLSSMGRSLGQKGSSTAKGAIQNTRGFKDWSQLRQRQVEKGRAEKTLAKLDKIQKRGGALSQKQQDKLRRAQDVVLAERKTERENKIRTQDGYADAMMYKQDIATDTEAAAIARLNDPVAQAAERESLAAKVVDEATAQRLSLMRSSGDRGGIVMNDGSQKAYTLSALEERMKELESNSQSRVLSSQEQQELSALARGMSSMSGGAGAMAKIIRNANNGTGGVNTNFMSAMGEIYARDGNVQAKLNEKDAGAAVYTEQFMPGGAGLAGGGGGVGTFASYQGTTDYQDEVGKRVKTHEVGLAQSGTALREYLDTIDASSDAKQAYQDILDNDKLLQSLDAKDLAEVRSRAELAGVKGKSTTMIDVAKGGSAETALNRTAAATSQTAVNTFAIRNDTGTIRNDTGQMALNTRQTAINTNRGANAAEQTALNTRQTAINTNRIAKGVNRPKK
ncbi:MFS transporter [Candidatus Saccharibacteria bacterium]|nr:MFS transporter [Candidatus Saccharibacteria bacterium]